MLVVYGQRNSRSNRLTWMLEELGEAYDYRHVAISKGEGRQASHLGINPGGKVPVLKDGDLTLTESAAILTYLAEKFPDKELIPAQGTNDRGLFHQWSYFAVCELEQPLWTMAKHRFAIPEKHRVPAVLQTAQWEFDVALKLLSQGLGENKYILGEKFSAADILIGHTLNWASVFGMRFEQENINAYRKRLNARPALAKAVAVEDDGFAG
jgi:glutathione S-transferase